MELCEFCQRIGNLDWGSICPDDTLKHHRSYENLRDSALNGCELCVLLRNGLVHSMEDYAFHRYTGCDWEITKVEQYLTDEDEDWPSEFILTMYDWGNWAADVEAVEGFRYGRISWDDGWDGASFKLKTPHGKSTSYHLLFFFVITSRD